MNGAVDRKRGSWINQALMLLAGVAALLWFLQARRAPVQLLEWRDCEHAYATARTSADTAAVDALQPLSPRRGATAVTCGALRRPRT
jgi:hypothetical protein